MDKAYIFKIPVSLKKKFDEMILIISRKIIK
jgi:hypothetical protein